MIEERTMYWPLGGWPTTEREKRMGTLMLENVIMLPLTPACLKPVELTIGNEAEARRVSEEGLKDLTEDWKERRFAARV